MQLAIVVSGSSLRVIIFSSPAGWWALNVPCGTVAVRASQPAKYTPKPGSGSSSSSIRQTSLSWRPARKIEPVWLSASEPPPSIPQDGDWKFQYATTVESLESRTSQWYAVRK